ncbi:MAG: glutathione S-transferase family protein [Gammaproteobacteria bacterium]|nr:glutathione S-transferase family protein [Gammaproteobacteria bacterium]
MSAIIFHHYPLSPFSEKIRRILAYKGLPWCSVQQPLMMPKPDLVALTGGYRRIPVLQIGADVYCDTALIARRLDELYPAKPLLPPAQAGLIGMVEDWADHRLFFQCVPPVIVALYDALPAGFLDDRAAMSPALTKDGLFKSAPQAWSQARLSLAHLEAQLAGKAFLFGEQFTLADAACYNPVWFLKNDPNLFSEVMAKPALAAWFARIEALPNPTITDLSAAAALEVARNAEPVKLTSSMPADEVGVALGDEVAVAADDYGPEQTAGRVTAVTHDSITIDRQDAALGAVAVHFPRAGYRVIKR